MRASPLVMSPRRARWIAVLHLAAIYVLSNLPTPLYALYRRAFGLSELMITIIFSVYVVGSIAVMFFLGRLSDQIGRRVVVVASAVIGVIAAVLFMLATSTPWLFAARIVSGVSIALVTGATTAWLLELDPRGDASTAARLAIIGNLFGLGIGPIIGGCLARWAPWPRGLSYVAFVVLLAPLAVLVWRAPETLRDRKGWRELSLAPRLGVPREIRRQFLPAALGAFAIFAVLGFYGAIVPSLMSKVLHVDNVAIAGAIVGEAYIVGTIAVAVVRKLDVRRWLVVALASLVPGLALLVAAQLARSMALLVIATAVTGAAGGFGYRACLQLVNEIAPKDRRSEVVSAFVIACYLAISIPVIGVGLLGAASSLSIAIIAFACLVGAMAIAALVAEVAIAH